MSIIIRPSSSTPTTWTRCCWPQATRWSENTAVHYHDKYQPLLSSYSQPPARSQLPTPSTVSSQLPVRSQFTTPNSHSPVVLFACRLALMAWAGRVRNCGWSSCTSFTALCRWPLSTAIRCSWPSSITALTWHRHHTPLSWAAHGWPSWGCCKSTPLPSERQHCQLDPTLLVATPYSIVSYSGNSMNMWWGLFPVRHCFIS